MNREAGGRYKWASEMDRPCEGCGHAEMHMIGFDGDTGAEDWECPKCEDRWQGKQMVIEGDRASLISDLAKECQEFAQRHRGLSKEARSISYEYIKPKRVLLDYLRGVGKSFFEPPTQIKRSGQN